MFGVKVFPDGRIISVGCSLYPLEEVKKLLAFNTDDVLVLKCWNFGDDLSQPPHWFRSFKWVTFEDRKDTLLYSFSRLIETEELMRREWNTIVDIERGESEEELFELLEAALVKAEALASPMNSNAEL